MPGKTWTVPSPLEPGQSESTELKKKKGNSIGKRLHPLPKTSKKIKKKAFLGRGPACCAGRCERPLPEDMGKGARGRPHYIKIEVSLAIVGHGDASSITNMRVLGAVGDVPRGGLARSRERETLGPGRPGGPRPSAALHRSPYPEHRVPLFQRSLTPL